MAALITILDAIRLAISTWDLDLPSEVIRKCFKRALSPEDTTEIQNQELDAEIMERLQALELANHIREAMDINQFLKPKDEQVHDGLMSIDDAYPKPIFGGCGR